MRAIFEAGRDYHQATAELISQVAWGIRPNQVQKFHRSIAKQVNFGLIYNMSDMGLAAKIGCTEEEAKKVRVAVLGKLHVLAAWFREQLANGKRNGGVEIPWDEESARWRPLWKIDDADSASRNNAENGCGNSPIQGHSSDLCLASLVETVRWILTEGVPAKVALTVHDSLVIEVDEDCVHEVVTEGKRIMESWPANGVPLVADVEIGTQWGEMVKYEDWRKSRQAA
jgi:DNA polymerase-1